MMRRMQIAPPAGSDSASATPSARATETAAWMLHSLHQHHAGRYPQPCLGGELSRSGNAKRHGKLQAWMVFTNIGHPFEFNTTYMSVNLRALKRLPTTFRTSRPVNERAMAGQTRPQRGVAHSTGTGGGRSSTGALYHPSVVCETPPEVELLRKWIDTAQFLLDRRRPRRTENPTWWGDRQQGGGLSHTYQTDEYALAHQRRLQSQATLYGPLSRPARIGGCSIPATSSTTKWFGGQLPRHRPQRRASADEGSFFGVPMGNRALDLCRGLNRNEAQGQLTGSARLYREFWIDDQRVESLPVDVRPAQRGLGVGSVTLYVLSP